MFSSLFRHRLLFVGVSILGIGYSLWVLQQDVRSPMIFRAQQTVWEGYSPECTPYREVGCTATSFGYEAPCCEYSYDQPLVKRYLNQPCFYQTTHPQYQEQEGELYLCREEFTCEGSVCDNGVCEPGEIDAQPLTQPYEGSASGNADDTEFYVSCSPDCSHTLSTSIVCGNGICEHGEPLDDQSGFFVGRYCPQDCTATIASALARQCIYSVSGASSSSSCPARDPNAICPQLNLACTFGYEEVERECEFDSRGCPYPRICAPDMRWNAVGDMKFGTDPIYGVTYGNGKFVAVGYNGKGAYSTDGANWTAINMAVGTTPLLAVTYGNGKFVSVGQSGKGAYSTNGTSWTALSGPVAGHLYSITYGNGKFVSVGAAAGMYSADGINWTRISDGHFNAPSAYKSVTYGNNKFVAVGFNGAGVYSTDGVTWTTISDMKFNASNITSVAYDAGRFVAVGYSGKGAYSDDGVTWTAVSDMRISSTEYNFYGSTYGGNVFMAVGVNGSYSVLGGTTWTPVADMKLGMSAINSIAYGNNKFVAVGQSGKGSYTGDAIAVSSSSSSSPKPTTGFEPSLIVQTSKEGNKFIFNVLGTVKNLGPADASSMTLALTVPNTLSFRASASNKECQKSYTPGSTVIYGCPYVDSTSHNITLKVGESKTFRLVFETYPKPSPFVIEAEGKKWVGDGTISPTVQWRWTCGNNTIETGEQCDGSQTSCLGQSCTDFCQCASVCGNGIVETGEQCEGVRQQLPSLREARAIDVNNDGKLDLVGPPKTNESNNGLRSYLNNGNGTFTLGGISPGATTQVNQAMVGDFDGDGNADGVIKSEQDKLFFLRGKGDGTFQTEEAIFADITFDSYYGYGNYMEVEDVNGDGADDLLVAYFGGAPVRLYMGGANFKTQTPRTFSSSYAETHLADLDHDGRIDVVYAEMDGNVFTRLTVLYSNGDGTFATPVSLPVNISKYNKFKLWYVNQDDMLDLLFASGASGQASSYVLSRTDRTLELQSAIINSYSPKRIEDVNGDGIKDLLECSAATCGSMSVKLGRGDGTYDQPLATSIPVGDVADFNGDGKADFYGTMTANAINDTFGVFISSCPVNQLCGTSCQCAAAVMTPVSSSSSSSSSAASVVPLCGNGQVNAGETCDYAAADSCSSGKMCSGSCSCIDCTPTGTPVAFSTKIGWTQASIPDIVKLSGDRALVAYYDKSALMSMGMARVAEINGSSITLGPAVQFTGEAPSPLAHGTPLLVFPVDSAHAIIAFTTSNKCKAVLATITGNTVSVSSSTALFNRNGGCSIAFDGTMLTRRYSNRVIEKAIPTITGNQIDWRFSEDDLVNSATYDRVSLGGGRDLRMSAATYMTQRWPFLARLFAASSMYSIGICNSGNATSCDCVGSSASCKQFPVQFTGAKIIPVGGNSYHVFTMTQGQWKVTPVTVNGNSLTIGTTVALSSFSFGSAFSSIPAIATGRFYVDVRGNMYGMENFTGFLRMDVAPDGTVSQHESFAGAHLTPLSYIRVYKGAGDSGMVQVTNRCTAASCIAEGQTGTTGGASTCCAGLTQLSQRNVNAQNMCESQTGTFVCTRCGAAPLGDGQCGLGENRCNCAVDCAGSSSSSSIMIDTISSSSGFSSSSFHTSSSSSIIVIDTISSSSFSSSVPSAVCGNFSLESGEECEMGRCCASGYSCDTRTCECTSINDVPTQNSTCGNYRVEAGEDCEDGLSTLQLPCTGTTICDVQTCRCPTGTARCSRWRSMP